MQIDLKLLHLGNEIFDCVRRIMYFRMNYYKSYRFSPFIAYNMTYWSPSIMYNIWHLLLFPLELKCSDGIIINMLTWRVVDCGFKPRSGQTKLYNGICSFFPKPKSLRSENNDLLAQNQDRVEWCIYLHTVVSVS